MQRIVMWFVSTITALVLLFGYHTSTQGAASAGSQVVISSGTTAAAGSHRRGRAIGFELRSVQVRCYE